MDKSQFLSLLNKYHLDGEIETVSILTKKQTATVKFINSSGDLIGEIICPSFDVTDSEIGIFTTSKLMKMLSICDKKITLSIADKSQIPKIIISDNVYDQEYVLADKFLIPKVPKVEEPEFDVNVSITTEIIKNIIDAKKVISSDIVKLTMVKHLEIPMLKFTFGDNNQYSDKISYSIVVDKIIPNLDLNFSSLHIKNILSFNKDLTKGNLYLSKDGLLKFTFESSSLIESKYFLVANGK